MAEEIVIGIKVDAEGASQTLGDLKKRTEDLKREIESEPIGSERFKQLQGEIKKADAQVKKLDESLQGLNPEQTADAFMKAAEGIAGGFAVVTGTMALFGTQSEEVEKALLKVQSALAIVQGVKMMTEGVKGLGTAFDTLKTVIMANPLLTLAVVIVGLTTAIIAFGEASDDAAQQQLKLASAIEDVENASKRGEEQIRKQVDNVGKYYDLQIRKAKALGQSTKELEEQKIKAQEDAVKKQTDLAEKGISIQEGLIRRSNKRIEDLNTAFNKRKDFANEQTYQLAKRNLERQIADEQIKIQTAKSTINEIGRLEGEANKFFEEKEIEKLEVRKSYAKKNVDVVRKNIEQVAIIPAKYVADAQGEIMANTTTFVEAQARQTERTIDIVTARITMFYDKVKLAQDFGLAQTGQSLDTLTGMFENAQERQLQAAEGNEAKQEEIRRKFFERNKKVQIAQAIIAAYQGAVNAFTSTAANPITVAFPAAPYIAAASALAAGLVNIQKIRQTQFEGGGDTGGGGGGGAPNFGGAPNINNTAIGSTQLNVSGTPPPSKVYVVESDITSAQKNVNGIVNKATID